MVRPKVFFFFSQSAKDVLREEAIELTGRTGWYIEEIPHNKVYRKVKERCQKSGWGWF